MRELSVFVDESGDQNGQSKYYAVTLVLHDQDDEVSENIGLYEKVLRDRGLPDIPFHASPLINGHDAYGHLEVHTRKSLLTTFLMFFKSLPVKYRTFLYRRSEIGDARALEARLRRDIVNLLFDNLDYFQDYDHVKIYYDDGQRVVSRALRDAFGYALSKTAVLHRKAAPNEYRLSQASDFLCTVELTAEKYRRREQTRTDEKFFGSAGSFRGNYMKAVKRKRLR